MKILSRLALPQLVVPILLICSVFWTGSVFSADVLREQTIQLQAGWNAVNLEVTPLETKPSEVFANLPVDIVARYFGRRSSVQFIDDPTAQDFNKPGWGVWYAPDRADAFLTSLHAVFGHCAYLVHATESKKWTITGKVTHKRLRWKTDSFNLQGFPVNPVSPPTFEQLFAGSGGKIGRRIYRLVNGSWVKITNPSTSRLRSGEACWIYCEGNTDYQGPLDIRITGVDELHIGDGDTREILVTNTLAEPASIRVVSTQRSGFDLHYVFDELSTLKRTYPTLPATVDYDLEPHESRRMELQSRIHEDSGTGLLKFTADSGMQVWVPVVAGNKVLTSP